MCDDDWIQNLRRDRDLDADKLSDPECNIVFLIQYQSFEERKTFTPKCHSTGWVSALNPSARTRPPHILQCSPCLSWFLSVRRTRASASVMHCGLAPPPLHFHNIRCSVTVCCGLRTLITWLENNVDGKAVQHHAGSLNPPTTPRHPRDLRADGFSLWLIRWMDNTE